MWRRGNRCAGGTLDSCRQPAVPGWEVRVSPVRGTPVRHPCLCGCAAARLRQRAFSDPPAMGMGGPGPGQQRRSALGAMQGLGERRPVLGADALDSRGPQQRARHCSCRRPASSSSHQVAVHGTVGSDNILLNCRVSVRLTLAETEAINLGSYLVQNGLHTSQNRSWCACSQGSHPVLVAARSIIRCGAWRTAGSAVVSAAPLQKSAFFAAEHSKLTGRRVPGGPRPCPGLMTARVSIGRPRHQLDAACAVRRSSQCISDQLRASHAPHVA